MAKRKKGKVVILGAGFSASAGIPPQRKLLKKILAINFEKEELDYEGVSLINDKQRLDLFLNILYRKEQNLGDLLLEDIYTNIDTAIVKQRNLYIFSPSALFNIRESLNRLVAYVVGREITANDIETYKNKLDKIIEPSTTFISLNWDFLLERVLTAMAYKIDYTVDLQPTFTQGGRKKKIPILKPHGSLNWELCPICETVYAFLERNIYKCKNCLKLYEDHKDKVNNLKDLAIGFDDTKTLHPILVSPTFLKNNHIPQLNLIMQKIYSALAGARKLLFIGYSLPISDHDIRDLLTKANSVNPETKVEVILKPNDDAEKNALKSHYTTIYSEHDQLTFDFEGF